MASRFATVSKDEILAVNEAAASTNSYVFILFILFIRILLRLPSTGLFSQSDNYYIILVIKKRKLICSSLIKFKMHSKLFKIYSKLFRMKHIIKKCPLKTINIFSVLSPFHSLGSRK